MISSDSVMPNEIDESINKKGLSGIAVGSLIPAILSLIVNLFQFFKVSGLSDFWDLIGVGFITCTISMFGGLLSIILGVVALEIIERSPNIYRGKKYAIAGLVLGIIVTFFVPIYFVMFKLTL